MAHTPGPWRPYFYVRNQRLKLGEWGCISTDSHPIPLRDVRKNDAVAAANARLIAAAPDLLAALRAVKSEFIDMYEECYPNDESDNDVTAAIDMVIAAIAKAEGRTDAIP